MIGYEVISDHISSVRPDAICVTPISASMAAFDAFGARKLAVWTPYVDEVNAMIAEYLQTAGKELCAFSSFHIKDNEDMAAVTGDEILNVALKADRPKADALFISCMAIRAVDVIDPIERILGKPVITSNQAMFWQALRSAGCYCRVEGYGTFLWQL